MGDVGACRRIGTGREIWHLRPVLDCEKHVHSPETPGYIRGTACWTRAVPSTELPLQQVGRGIAVAGSVDVREERVHVVGVAA